MHCLVVACCLKYALFLLGTFAVPGLSYCSSVVSTSVTRHYSAGAVRMRRHLPWSTTSDILQRLSSSDLEESDNNDEDGRVTTPFVVPNSTTTTLESNSTTVSSSPSSSSASSSPADRDKNLLFLQTLGAITGRGEFASERQHQAARMVVRALEESNPTPKPALSKQILGRWELAYTDTQLFRSSPFFMAGRAVCTTNEQRDQYNWFCELHRLALSISTIKAVRQIVTSHPPQIISEVEVMAGALPFVSGSWYRYSGGLPVAVTGALVTTANRTDTECGTGWILTVDRVQIKGSNIPLVRQVLDASPGLALSGKTRRWLDTVLPASLQDPPLPIFRTVYLDDSVRISRDQDDHIFCYVKTTSDQSVTDYQVVDADLGFLKLVEGFNDAITRNYL